MYRTQEEVNILRIYVYHGTKIINTLLYSWKLVRKYILEILNTKNQNLKKMITMEGDGFINYTYCGNHFTIYTYIKSLISYLKLP